MTPEHPETTEEKIDSMYKAMIGDEFDEGFIKRFQRYCVRVRKLEFTMIALIFLLIGLGIINASVLGWL